MDASTESRCSFPGCNRDAWSKGLCNGHYGQANRGKGLTPLKTRLPGGAPLRDRIEFRSEPNGECTDWTGALDIGGYAVMKVKGRTTKVHRLVVEIDEGAALCDSDIINHLCGNRKCIERSHLEVTDYRGNNTYRTVMNRNNTSGVAGVTKQGHKWLVQLKINRENIRIGPFESIEEAARVSEKARSDAGYSFPTAEALTCRH